MTKEERALINAVMARYAEWLELESWKPRNPRLTKKMWATVLACKRLAAARKKVRK